MSTKEIVVIVLAVISFLLLLFHLILKAIPTVTLEEEESVEWFQGKVLLALIIMLLIEATVVFLV